MRLWTDGRPRDGGERGRSTVRPLSSFRAPRALAWVALASAVGCGGARAGTEQSSAPSTGRVITADVIATSGAKTAWDAVRLTVPNVQLRESRGRPARIQRRGRASIYLDDQVRVIVDKREALRPP